MSLKKFWKEVENPAALFIGLVVAIVFCWLVYVRCTEGPDAIRVLPKPDAASPAPDAHSIQPDAAPRPHVSWVAVEDLGTVSGRWVGSWDGSPASAEFEPRGEAGRSLYPWRLKFRPEQTVEPFECGFYPKLHHAPQEPATQSWRVSYCRGGPFAADGGGRYAKRLLLLRSTVFAGRISVQVGNEYFAELKRP